MTDDITWGQRRADAMGRLAEVALAADLDAGTAGDRYQVVLHVDATTTAASAAGGEFRSTARWKWTIRRFTFPRKRHGVSPATPRWYE